MPTSFLKSERGEGGEGDFLFMHLASVVQKLDSAIHRINHYPVDNAIGFPYTYPLEQRGPGLTKWAQLATRNDNWETIRCF